MTEGVSKDDAERSLRFSDAVRFFEKVTKDGKCTACGDNQWEIPTRAGDTGYCFLQKSGGIKGGVRAFNINLDCATCGMVRTHRVQQILQWLEDNPGEGLPE